MFREQSRMIGGNQPRMIGGKQPRKRGGKLAVRDIKNLLNASYDLSTPTGDFVLDTTISKPRSSVFFNAKTGQAVVSHRGTDSATDWGNNLVYGIGGDWAYKKTARYKEAEKVQKLAEAKYGAQNVSTLGHSQAGKISELVGTNSREIITLNKATRLGSNKVAPNEYDIRSSGDAVSALNPTAKKSGKEITIAKKSNNPLEEHSIDILDRLPQDEMIGQGKSKEWKLHAVIIHKNIPLDQAKKISQDIIKNKNKKFMREEKNTYRFRNIPKTHFKEFKAHKVNDNITMIFGKLKPENVKKGKGQLQDLLQNTREIANNIANKYNLRLSY
jgi:DNA-directed RNA polymerase subunit F